MRTLIIGLGSIGERYAHILTDHYKDEVGALRLTDRKVQSELPLTILNSWEAAEEFKPEMVIITNPTSCHIQTAIECAKRGWPTYIEKPLDSSTQQLDEYLNLVKEHNVTTYVAYVLRFHPFIEKLKDYFLTNTFCHMQAWTSSYLPNWRPNQNHLESYSANSDLGGGVIYDLSHELDYVSYFLGDLKKVQYQFARRSNVTVDAEDVADVIATTDRGMANIHLNFLSHVHQRACRVDFVECSVAVDFVAGTFVEYVEGKEVKREEYESSKNGLFIKQLDYFRANINNPSMVNNAFEASKLLKKLCEIKGQVYV